MAGVKYSRQRQAIIDYLCSTKEHPTAETVYTNVRIQYPNVSLGTVYRNLNLLADEGEILRLTCGDGSDRFDGNPKQVQSKYALRICRNDVCDGCRSCCILLFQ